ncbi:MAG: C-terminal binding protein [Natronomonas sp.]
MVTVVTDDSQRIRTETLQSNLGPEVGVRSVSFGSTEQLVKETADADALVVSVDTPVPAEVFERSESLRIVARAGTGVDNIDIAAAADRGVAVTNVPEYCTEEVSTHAVSLLLNTARRIKSYDHSVESGRWHWSEAKPIHRLADRTVGFHSFGSIARRTAEKLSGFGCDLVAFDPYVDAEAMAEYGVEAVSFEELLARSDAVSIHAPLTEETYHLFDREAFERMDKTSAMINVGRGGIVDEAALCWALDTGEIAAAGLDVFENEPPDDSPLVGRDDAVVTPHSAFYSEASIVDLNERVAANVAAVFDGETPEGLIDPSGEWA